MFLRLSRLSRAWKRRLVLAIDIALILVAFVLALSLRLGDHWPVAALERSWTLCLGLVAGGVVLAPILGIPSIKLSTFDLRSTTKIGLFALILAGAGTVLNIAMSLGAPRTVPTIFGIVLFALLLGWKAVARGLVVWLSQRNRKRIPVAIYGAGAAGIQLTSALNQNNEYRPVALVDDNPGLRDVFIGGLRVQPPAVLRDLAACGQIERVVLAMPSVPKRRRREIAASLQDLPCEVHATAGYAELVSSGDLLTSVKSISSDELLGRDAVDLEIPDVARAYAGKSVLISGAGGSIGSELCRQVLSCRPRRIVLYEISEYALYTIDREIRPLAAEAGVEVVTLLGSVCDRASVHSALASNAVQIVIHAAAYKHVPLVEDNEVEGVKNNVLGTRILAEVARELGIERFILISTDKAVRPTNVMGGTKRLAEMIVQDLQTRSADTKFAMVRFGNVLGSSGSVIPLFSSQIAAGGPVTLTDPEVTRYFMTVSEAARLVLLAGSYANGGDLFVLDMGRPTRIMNLARRMISLSGLTVKDADNPDGDIEIAITGLRPGEKLYEELLIDGAVLSTPHAKILRAEESCPSQIEIASLMQELRLAVEARSAEAVRRQIARWVEGYCTVEAGSQRSSAS